jgi:predicted nucleic acid-binding protein
LIWNIMMPVGPTSLDTVLALDSDVLHDWRAGKHFVKEVINNYIAQHKASPALTSFTVFEAVHGFENAALKLGEMSERLQKDIDHMRRLTNECVVLPFDDEAAALAGYIFPRLSRSERNLLWKDLFIAATALIHGYGVATRNKRDFELIAGHVPANYPRLRLSIWKP